LLFFSPAVSKNTKISYVTKKPSITFNVVKKETEIPQRRKKKSYIPLYLQRKLLMKMNDAVDKNLESNLETTISAEHQKPVKEILRDLQANTESIKKKIMDFNPMPRENMNYLVFRNEIEVKKNSSTDCDSSLNTIDNGHRKADELNNSSSQSLNSSACSSPNSIATVRARTNIKLFSNKKHSSSCNKNNFDINNGAENGPGKNKKYTKRCKSAKKSQDMLYDNKENMPESSKKAKESERMNKNAFLKNKNVFRAEISPDSSPQINNNNITKHKSQILNKSNIKIPSIPSPNQKRSISGASSSKPPIKRQSSPKSKISLISKFERNSDSSDVGLRSNSENINSDLETPKNNVIVNIVDNNLLNEWINSTTYNNVDDKPTRNLLHSMRLLIEDRLDFIENLSDNGAEVDSKTVVLGSEQFESMPTSRATSYHDIISLNSMLSEVIEKNDLDYAQITDIENSFFDSVVYNNNDPVSGDDSIISVSDTKPTVTDLDMLSFKSLASTSKLSEYFLAESSLSNVAGPVTLDVPASNSVRDIFERKTPLRLQVCRSDI
jgi:hypothetical protein